MPGVRATLRPASRPPASDVEALTSIQHTPMNSENKPNDRDHDNDGPNWKWWHFVLAGLLIAAWCIWRWRQTGSIKHLGGLILAALCLLVGWGSRKPNQTP